jgi:hypothetical protein
LRSPSCASTANRTLRPSTSRTRAVATTVRPIGVGARWRTLTSLQTIPRYILISLRFAVQRQAFP